MAAARMRDDTAKLSFSSEKRCPAAAISVRIADSSYAGLSKAHATFSLVMLVTTLPGDAYTVVECRKMPREAGFTKNDFVPILQSLQYLIISRNRSRARRHDKLSLHPHALYTTPDNLNG